MFALLFAERPLWVTSRHITSDCSTGGYAMNTVEKLLARNTNVYESELLLSCVLEKEFGRTVVRIFLRKSSSRSIKNSFSTVFDVKQSFEGRNFENSVRASALFNTSRSFILLATVGSRPEAAIENPAETGLPVCSCCWLKLSFCVSRIPSQQGQRPRVRECRVRVRW